MTCLQRSSLTQPGGVLGTEQKTTSFDVLSIRPLSAAHSRTIQTEANSSRPTQALTNCLPPAPALTGASYERVTVTYTAPLIVGKACSTYPNNLSLSFLLQHFDVDAPRRNISSLSRDRGPRMTAVCNGRNTCTQLGDSGQINGGAKYRAGIFMGRLSLGTRWRTQDNLVVADRMTNLKFWQFCSTLH